MVIGFGVFYFDEIQNVVGWERFVRRLHDDSNKVFVTGSNANLLSRELGTHLTGRYVALEMYPFSFQEYLNFRGHDFSNFLSADTKMRVKMRAFFLQYVADGGFPEFLKTGNRDYLNQLYENIIYRDIVGRYGLNNERALKD